MASPNIHEAQQMLKRRNIKKSPQWYTIIKAAREGKAHCKSRGDPGLPSRNHAGQSPIQHHL